MEGITFYFEWEIWLMKLIQQYAGEFGALFASAMTYFGEKMIIIIIVTFMYWCYDKEFGRYLGVSICFGIVINSMAKNIFLRRRPYMDNPDIKCFKPPESNTDIYDIAAQGYSFPSGHSCNAVVTYCGIGLYKNSKKIFIGGLIISVFVAVSRFVIGVHYPTDVIAGTTLGFVCIFLISFLLKKIKDRRILYLILFLISCLGLFYCKSEDYFSSLGIMGGFFIGDIVEEKYIGFENTRIWYKCILRLLAGFALFFIFNTLLKLPFSEAFLDSGTLFAGVVRSLRYMVVLFILIGIYPRAFKYKAFR